MAEPLNIFIEESCEVVLYRMDDMWWLTSRTTLGHNTTAGTYTVLLSLALPRPHYYTMGGQGATLGKGMTLTDHTTIYTLTMGSVVPLINHEEFNYIIFDITQWLK